MAEYDFPTQRPPATDNLPGVLGAMRQGGSPMVEPETHRGWELEHAPADSGRGLPGGGEASSENGFPKTGPRRVP